MTSVTWWPHEVRRCGRQASALPCLGALVAAAAVVAGSGGNMLLGRSLLTSALPTAAALACASVVARERMVELHLSLPTPYRRTVARRLAWPAAVTALAASALAVLAAVTETPVDAGGTLVELAGVSALLAGAAVWVTVRSGSAGPATGLVVAAVLAKLLLVDRFVAGGAGQGVPALAAGGLLIWLALRSLGPGAAGAPAEAGDAPSYREGTG